MLIRINGGKSGIKEYLENGQKNDRYYSRNELDCRVILNGDLEVADDIINSIDDTRDRYLHITLAFKEDTIPDSMLSDISKDFRDFYFKAYNDDEIHYYSEAHLPKIKSYVNAKTGESIDRKPHIHIIVPTINLTNGAPIYPKTTNYIKFIDAFQEHINSKYGLESPKDNPRYKINENSELISRYKGDGFKGKNREVREQIFDEIIENNIGSFSEFKKHLDQKSYLVKVRNEGKGHDKEYYNIIDKSGVSINLRDKVFQAEFLSKTADEKVAALRSNIAYIEPDKIRKNTDIEYQKLLNEWNDYKAYEYKYLNSVSVSERSNFQRLTIEQKKVYVSLKHNDFYEDVVDGYRTNDTAPGSNGRENVEQDYIDAINYNLRSANAAIKNTGDNLRKIGADRASPIGRERRREIAERYARIIAGNQHQIRRDITDFSQHQYRGQEIRKSNPVDEVSVNKKLSWSEVKTLSSKYNNEIQGDVLLELLEKTHGVNPELYRITKASDGADRIGCGSRNLNMMDFCTKEMYFSAQQSVDILNNVYNMQQDINRERGWSREKSLYLSQEYKDWFKSYKVERTSVYAKHKDDFKAMRTEIIEKYNEKIFAVKNDKNITYRAKREQINVLRVDKLLELDALDRAKKIDNSSLKDRYNLEMQKAYRTFLVNKANDGNEDALQELRRLRIKYEGIGKSDSLSYVDRYHEYKLNITYKVDDNGVINYQHNGKTILQDHGKRVSVVRHTDENVKLTLELAMSKFGTNIALTGSEKFRKKAVEIAIKSNYKINFIDEFSRKHFDQLITEYKANQDRLDSNKFVLFADHPKTLYVSRIGQTQVINDKGRCSLATTLELTDPVSKKVYEVSGHKINFMDKSLVKGQFVEVSRDNTNDILVRSTDIDRELRKAKAAHIEKARKVFVDRVKAEYGISSLKETYTGRLLSTGIYKGNFYAVISDSGETKRIWNNKLKDLFSEQGIKKNDVISLAIPETKSVKIEHKEKSVSINSTNTFLSDLLLEIDLHTGGKKYRSEYFGRVTLVKAVTLKSGRGTNVVTFSDNLSGRYQTLYMDNTQGLKANDFVYLGEKSFNTYDVINVNDKIESKRKDLLGSNNSKDVIIGDITKLGIKSIRGNGVYYVEMSTDVGVITKYGEKVREIIESQGLKVGDGVIFEDKEQILTTQKEESIIEVAILDKDIDKIVESRLEKMLETIEQDR